MTDTSLDKEREELTHKTFMLMIKVAFIFGVPAALAFFVGRLLDNAYDIRPNGTLVALAVSFVLSWIITIVVYRKMSRAFKDLERRESEESK